MQPLSRFNGERLLFLQRVILHRTPKATPHKAESTKPLIGSSLTVAATNPGRKAAEVLPTHQIRAIAIGALAVAWAFSAPAASPILRASRIPMRSASFTVRRLRGQILFAMPVVRAKATRSGIVKKSQDREPPLVDLQKMQRRRFPVLALLPRR
jgi:hypothetical protein